MPVFVAMLRGLNVGGRKKVLMADLRKSCEELGFEQVQTYVQSGNVIFKTGKGSADAFSKKIEGTLLEQFGWRLR